MLSIWVDVWLLALPQMFWNPTHMRAPRAAKMRTAMALETTPSPRSSLPVMVPVTVAVAGADEDGKGMRSDLADVLLAQGLTAEALTEWRAAGAELPRGKSEGGWVSEGDQLDLEGI